jgi:hypothetical protein
MRPDEDHLSMQFSILNQSFLNQKKAMAVTVVSVAVGTAIAASFFFATLRSNRLDSKKSNF